MTPHIFGKTDAKPSFRGLVISNPIEVDGQTLRPKGGLDLQELRASLLFWDQLRWPDNLSIGFGTGREAEYLRQQQILSRPTYSVDGDVAEGLVYVQYRAFLDASREAPGCWALGTGINSVQVVGQEPLPDARGLLVSLYSAIPVPDAVVPLDEVLDFKRQNAANLRALRAEIEGLYEAVVRSADKELSLRRAREKIDAECELAVRAARASGFPTRLGDWKISYSLPFGQVVAYAAFGEMFAQPFALPGVGALLGAAGAAASGLQIAWERPLGGMPHQQTPYRYVTEIHRELL